INSAPTIDVHEGLFGYWCDVNFKHGIPEASTADLQQDYFAIDAFDHQRSAPAPAMRDFQTNAHHVDPLRYCGIWVLEPFFGPTINVLSRFTSTSHRRSSD